MSSRVETSRLAPLTGRELCPPPTPHARLAPSPSAPGPRARFGAASVRNVRKGTENQDSFVASQNPNGSKCLVGVFDGHGERGKEISSLAARALSQSLYSSAALHDDPARALEAAVDETQARIARHHRPSAQHSGTTAIAAYQHRDQLCVSRAALSTARVGRRARMKLRPSRSRARSLPQGTSRTSATRAPCSAAR